MICHNSTAPCRLACGSFCRSIPTGPSSLWARSSARLSRNTSTSLITRCIRSRRPRPSSRGYTGARCERGLCGNTAISAYDMVRFQEVAKYGRASGVDFGPVDVIRFAEAFGAKGLKIETPDQISSTIRKALEMQGPVIIGIPVDYRDNHRLMGILHPSTR